MGSVAVCMLKHRVKTTETDKRHVVSFSNVRFSKVPMDFGFHADLHAERHWYSSTKFTTRIIKAVLSNHEGIGQPAYRNPACIVPGCTGKDH